MLSGYTYTKYKPFFTKDRLVTITGRVRRRENDVTVMVERLETWEKVRRSSAKKIYFLMSFRDTEEEIVDRLHNILAAYPGEDEVYVQNKDDNKLYAFGALRTEINPTMITELCGLLGEENIKVV